MISKNKHGVLKCLLAAMRRDNAQKKKFIAQECNFDLYDNSVPSKSAFKPLCTKPSKNVLKVKYHDKCTMRTMFVKRAEPDIHLGKNIIVKKIIFIEQVFDEYLFFE